MKRELLVISIAAAFALPGLGHAASNIAKDQRDAEMKRIDAKAARAAPGVIAVYTGADLANVINEAALLSVRARKPAIEMPELEEAVQRVLHGTQRRGRVLTEEERLRAAYHESGHAIVSAACGTGEEVHRVSILARGKSLGATGIQRESDAYLLTRNQIYRQLVTTMGGLAAEEGVLFGAAGFVEKRYIAERLESAIRSCADRTG